MAYKSPRTKGDLCGLNTMDEQTYGQPAGGTSTHRGILLTFKSPDAVTVQDMMRCGSRLSGGKFQVGRTAKYSATFNAVRGQGTVKYWLTQALGGTTVQSDLPSHTAVVNVTGARQNTDREIHYYFGSMVDNLNISASELGGPVELAVDTISRYHTISDNVTAPKMDDGTDGNIIAPVPVPVEPPVTNSQQIAWSRDNKTATYLYAPQWSLSITNSLQAVPSIGGTESDWYRLDAGEKSIPQASNIEFSFTIPSRDATWDKMRLEFVNDLIFDIIIDGVLITMEDCTLDSSMPDRKSESGYDETVKVTVGKITISDVQA